MKRIYRFGIASGVLAAALISGAAYAHGFGGFGGGHHGGLVPPIVGSMVSHDQMRTIFQANKGDLQNLHTQMKTARQQLENDLIAGKDTSADVTALQTAQNNMLAERVKIAQQVVATLSPEQRTKVSQFMTQWRSLHEQERQLFQQYGGATQGE